MSAATIEQAVQADLVGPEMRRRRDVIAGSEPPLRDAMPDGRRAHASVLVVDGRHARDRRAEIAKLDEREQHEGTAEDHGHRCSAAVAPVDESFGVDRERRHHRVVARAAVGEHLDGSEDLQGGQQGEQADDGGHRRQLRPGDVAEFRPSHSRRPAPPPRTAPRECPGVRRGTAGTRSPSGTR